MVLDVRGLGDNTINLVRAATDLRTEGDYDQVWCVFDRDSFPAANFNEALHLARQEGIEVAYSNEAFELWYLLHFDFVNTAISRTAYITNLEARIGGGYKYTKNSEDMHASLWSRQQVAIRNAGRLLALYDPCRPAEDNPSTTVHLLVKELIKFSV